MNKVLALLLIPLLLFAVFGKASARAGNCLDGSIKLDYSSDHYEYDISGYTLNEIALKAGTECYTEKVAGCYSWKVKNDVLIIDRIGDGNQCKAISHIEFTLKEVELTETPVATNTPKPTQTPRPTNTNTPRPTRTDKPDPTKTPRTPTEVVRITDTPTDDPDDPNPTATLITPTISFLLGTATPTATSEADCEYKEEKSCDYGCSQYNQCQSCGYQQCQIPPSSILIENFTDIEGLIDTMDRIFLALIVLIVVQSIGLLTRKDK